MSKRLTAGMFWVCLGIAVPAAARQAPTIRVPVRLVIVPTLVVSGNGKYVSGLSLSDFSITDNGLPVRPKLDIEAAPLSVAVVVQMDSDVREYLPFISKTGPLLENSIAAVTGEIAVVAYNDEVSVLKPFETGDVRDALRRLSPSGHKQRLLDAGSRAVGMLRDRPSGRSRILLFIGQPAESGSKVKAEELAKDIERNNIAAFALELPLFGKSFISDSFRLSGLGSQAYRGGYQASVELTRAIPALKRAAQVGSGTDLFSLLTTTTGGIQTHFRRQSQLENALIAMGEALRNRYRLSYLSDGAAGPHKIVVRVDVPGAVVYSRPGYQLFDE